MGERAELNNDRRRMRKTKEERAKNWRKFATRKYIFGTKFSNHQTRAPQYKMEERPTSAPKIEDK